MYMNWCNAASTKPSNRGMWQGSLLIVWVLPNYSCSTSATRLPSSFWLNFGGLSGGSSSFVSQATRAHADWMKTTAPTFAWQPGVTHSLAVPQAADDETELPIQPVYTDILGRATALSTQMYILFLVCWKNPRADYHSLGKYRITIDPLLYQHLSLTVYTRSIQDVVIQLQAEDERAMKTLLGTGLSENRPTRRAARIKEGNLARQLL